MRRSLPILTLLILAACSSAPEAKYDSDPSANFTHYKTYAWAGSKPGVVISTAEARPMSPLTAERITNAINAQLAAKGYSIAAKPDFVIEASVGARKGIDVQQWGPYNSTFGYMGGMGTTDISDYTEGTLAVDVYDAASKKPVWRGYTSKRLGSGSVTEDEVNAAVQAIFAKFPPPK